MMTSMPRPCASRPYDSISSGMRCAETTSASYAMPNSPSAVAAASIVGQSESEPITIPTRGDSVMGHSSCEQCCRAACPVEHVVEIRSVRRHVAHLPAGLDGLAVEVDLDVGLGGQHDGTLGL